MEVFGFWLLGDGGTSCLDHDGGGVTKSNSYIQFFLCSTNQKNKNPPHLVRLAPEITACSPIGSLWAPSDKPGRAEARHYRLAGFQTALLST